MPYRKCTHVIINLEGTLLDTEAVHMRAIGTIAEKYGRLVTTELQQKVMGTSLPTKAAIVIADLKLPITVEQFSKKFKLEVSKHLDDLQLFPGAERIIRHFHKHKVPMALESYSTSDDCNAKIRKFKELFKLFHHVVAGASDPEVKLLVPYPDIFIVCAARFAEKPAPEKCLVLEDAQEGVTAALSAKMQVVLIPSKNAPTDLLLKKATLTLPSLLDFAPEMFGFPPFGDVTSLEETLTNVASGSGSIKKDGFHSQYNFL